MYGTNYNPYEERGSRLTGFLLFLFLDLAIGGSILFFVHTRQTAPALDGVRAAYASVGQDLAALGGSDVADQWNAATENMFRLDTAGVSRDEAITLLSETYGSAFDGLGVANPIDADAFAAATDPAQADPAIWDQLRELFASLGIGEAGDAYVEALGGE